MSGDAEHYYFVSVGALFVIGGALIALASLRAKNPRKLWALYGLEFLQVGIVLLPAVFGSPWMEASYGIVALWCGRELGRCFSTGAVRWAWPKAVLVMLVAFASVIWLARSSLASFAFLYSLIEINDTAAWAAGSAFGKHKLWPRISPNKTWEGLFGGALACVLLAFALRFLLPAWSTTAILASGLFVFATGTAADLIASAWKRRAGLTVYADLVPHQGGLFDLYDSFALATPAWLGWQFCVTRLS